MWYDRLGVWAVLLIAGIAMICAGIWLYAADDQTPGVVLMLVGVAAAMIGLRIMRFRAAAGRLR
ncbi:MAG: hypothetical protein LBH69_00170 [Methanomassiliicoccaceae archaeon]|jgi:hypothetical protein|nr:hypothetical protein [Methanomassiliicoccaceae archaeon]